jgi:two-component system, OmpR family, response regulator
MDEQSFAPCRPCIALFEPEPLAAAAISSAMRAHAMHLALIPDIGVHSRPYDAPEFDAVIFNPFRSCLPMDAALRAVRKAIGNRPILALTPNDCTHQRTAAIIYGADDAIWAGGQGEEITARMGALLRRYGSSTIQLCCDDLEIDLLLRKVRRAGRNITMPLREFDLLAQLARSAGQIVSRRDLLSLVWQIDFDPGTNRVEVHMSRLRQRVDAGHSHALLQTVKGSGYALVSRTASLQI